MKLVLSLDVLRSLMLMFFLGALAGCTPSYILYYETEVRLNGSEVLADNIFAFQLLPAYNGVLFSVENKTDRTARILWDNSYFIMPNGNSYRALNTDILEEESEVVEKAEYTSSIPSHSTFSRFTTSTTFANKMSHVKVSQFYRRWGDLVTINTNILEEESLQFEPYWPYKTSSLEKLRDFANGNNRLGLGLVLEWADREIEYRFDITIKEVLAINLRRILPPAPTRRARVGYRLEYRLNVGDWDWQEVGEEWVPKK